MKIVYLKYFLFLLILSIHAKYWVFTQSITNVQGEDSIKEEKLGVWINVEYGHHSEELLDQNIGTGVYNRLILEIPIDTGITLPFILDRWKFQSFHAGLGLGIKFIIPIINRVDFSVAPSIIKEEDALGLLLPALGSYRFLSDKFRIHVSISYRMTAQLSPAGGESISFLIYSLGLGVQLR